MDKEIVIKDLEILLYKRKINNVSIIDFIPMLSGSTIQSILCDLKNCNLETSSGNESHKVYIFTDGNCKKNGQIGSKAGYAVYFTDDKESIYYPLNFCSKLVDTQPTNQKAELTAMLKAFEILNENEMTFNDKDIVIVSDSMYAIKCLTDWYKNWERNNWKTAKGETIKNESLIKTLIGLKKKVESARGMQFKFKHVHSHTVCPQNRDSNDYLLWYGNNQVDTMINQVLK